MASRPLFPVIDAALGGRLNDELVRLRTDGRSNEWIARWLYTEHNIEVSVEMIRRWVNNLPEPEAAAS